MKIRNIINTYNEGEYSSTISQGNRFLRTNPNYQGAELIVLYQMMVTSYVSERNTANNNNNSLKVNRLNNELKQLLNKVLIELRKKQLPKTWLSKLNNYHKPSTEWNTWRRQNISIYENLLDEIYNYNKKSSPTSFQTSTAVVSKKPKSGTSNTTTNTIDLKNLELFKITERGFDSLLDSAYDKFVGFYSLDDNSGSLKNKNILLKNSFMEYDNLRINNYLIFKDFQSLFLIELSESDNNINNRLYLSEVKTLQDDISQVESFKNKFQTPSHSWIFVTFIENAGELYKKKKGKIEISKKWKTIMRKKFARSATKNVPPDFTAKSSKVLYKGKEFFDLNKIDNYDKMIRGVISRNREMLMKVSDYNYSNNNSKNIDLLKNIKNNFSLFSDLKMIGFSSLFEEKMKDLSLYNPNVRPNIYKIVFDQKDKMYSKAFIRNSKLFAATSNDLNFDRIIDIVPEGLKISVGRNFSYSDIILKKHPQSEAIIKYFKNYFLDSGDLVNLEETISSFSAEKDFIADEKNNNLSTDENELYSIDYSNKIKEVNAIGQGKTYAEAIRNAQRSAVEQVDNKIFSSSTVKGDDLVNDEIMSISAGYIEDSEIINSDQLSDGSWEIKIMAKVSESRKKNYFKKDLNKGIVIDNFALSSMIKDREKNKLNEEKKILQLCQNEFDRFIKESIVFDYELVKNFFNSNSNKWDVQIRVDWSLNQNYSNFQDNFWSSINQLAITDDALKIYEKYGFPFYKFGNIYLRSQKSINIVAKFLSSINYYPSNFYLEFDGKKYFPEGISYDYQTGRRIQKKSEQKYKFISTDISIGGLVYLNTTNDESKYLDSHNIDRLYGGGSGQIPINRGAKLFNVNGKKVYNNTFLKNAAIDYRDVDDKTKNNIIIDKSSVIKSGSHIFNYSISNNEWLKFLENNSKIPFTNNNEINKYNTIYSKKVETKPSKTSSVSSSNAKSGTIIGNNIWVRNSPTNGDVIMTLNNNDACKIIGSCCEETIRGKKSQWYKIEYNGKTGWVFGSQLKLKTNTNDYIEKNAVSNELAVIHDDDGWSNVRAGKSTSFQVLFKIYDGQEFTIISNDGKWSYIDYNGRRGYMHNSIIKTSISNKNKKSTNSTAKNSTKKTLKDYISTSIYYNLISYWAFNGKINALVGNNFKKVNNRSLSYSRDRFGNYNSAYSDNIRLTSQISSSAFTSNSFTLSFLINTNYGSKKIFKISESEDKYVSIEVENGYVVLKLTTPGSLWGSNTNTFRSRVRLNNSSWNHIIVSYDFAPNSDQFSYYIYQNGKQVLGASPFMLNSKNFKPTQIKTYEDYLYIDDVTLWNKSFSNSERAFLYDFHKKTDLIKEQR